MASILSRPQCVNLEKWNITTLSGVGGPCISFDCLWWDRCKRVMTLRSVDGCNHAPFPGICILNYIGVAASGHFMMMSCNGSIFRVTGLFCGEFTGRRWIPRTKAGDTELWYFLWSVPEQTTKQTVETQVIWDAIAVIMKSLYCCTAIRHGMDLLSGYNSEGLGQELINEESNDISSYIVNNVNNLVNKNVLNHQ